MDWINFVQSMEKIVGSFEHFSEFSCSLEISRLFEVGSLRSMNSVI